jgi:ribosomal protein L11 methyltransferase
VRLIAVDLRGHDPELVADRCWQAGAAGLWEVDDHTLRAGVEDDLVDRFFRELADLTPIDVTDSVAVELPGRGTRLEVAGHRIELEVPATVFGDGLHPTTSTCLELLPPLVSAGTTVLDVGCGAGALAIGAALAGGRVTAIDVDPDAVEAAATNAATNGVEVEISATPLDAVDGPFDVVVANLTIGDLRPLARDLVRVTAPGGTLVLSGLLEDQWSEVAAAVDGDVSTLRVVDGWVTAVVRLSGS